MNERERVAVVLRGIKTLPTLPDIAMRLLEMGEDPTTSASDLARLIEKDLSLAARVLKLVNSSFFGVRREITSVQHALMILGIAHLRSLVLSGAVADLFDRSGAVGAFDRQEFWKHSVAVAASSRVLAVKTKAVDPEIAFTAGLIHDMGKVVEDRYLHSDFVRIVEMLAEPGVTMSVAEASVLGVSHAEIGQHLAIYWNLPQILCDSVGFHHKPQDAKCFPAMAAIVGCADGMVRRIGIGNGGGADHALPESSLRLCGLSGTSFNEIEADLSAVLEEQIGSFVTEN